MKQWLSVILFAGIGSILFLMGSAAQAQSVTKFGIKGGIQTAGMSSEPSLDGRVWGYSVYAYADRRIHDYLSFNLDIGITQRGFKSSQDETDETGQFIREVTATSKMTYVSISPVLNLDIGQRLYRPYFGVGPRVDFLAERSPGEFKFTEVTVADETVDHFDSTVLGFSLVAGFKRVSAGGIGLRLEAKYESDFTDSLGRSDREFKNNAYMLVLGIGF